MNYLPKILYVDDEMINLQLFEINLSKRYQVYTAISGSAGLDILENNLGIRCVISDMKMPHMNGLEFIKKAKEKYPHLTFIILTGFEISNEIQEALDSKLIIEYLKKPFNMNKIHTTISKVFD